MIKVENDAISAVRLEILLEFATKPIKKRWEKHQGEAELFYLRKKDHTAKNGKYREPCG